MPIMDFVMRTTIILILGICHATDFLSAGEIAQNRRGATVLSKLAANMKPGEWAELKTDMPKGLWSSPRVNDRGGLHIAGWTDDSHWDSRTGQLLYMGMRQTRQFIAYSEEKNAWRIISLDRNSDNPVFETKFGHIYGNNAFDPQTGRFFHRYAEFDEFKGGISAFDASKETWTKLPPVPPVGTASGSGMCIEYFSAWKGLVVLGSRIRFFNDETQQWKILDLQSPVDGYHSLFRHNPYRHEILLAGGNNSPNVVARLRKDGVLERLKDFPLPIGVRSDKLTIDPTTARYLLLHRDRKLYDFDSDKSDYRLIDDFSKTAWPFHQYDMPIVAFIPEYGVTIWAGTNKVWLYKHKAD